MSDHHWPVAPLALTTFTLFPLLSFLLLPSSQAAPVEEPFPSPHRIAAELLPGPDLPSLPQPIAGRATVTFARMVMGYYSAVHSYPSSMIPYEHLTHLNWFGINVDSSGNVTATNGWGSSDTDQIVSTAHSFGVKVLVTAINFDPDEICALVDSSTNRNTLISNLVFQVETGGADGVSLDLESPSGSCMGGFETLVAELADALHAADPEYHLSLALLPIDWSDVYNYDVLAAAADSLFIMGYNFHWSSSDPGPVDPLYASSTWGRYCLDYAVEAYLAEAGAYADKIILGLPLYGYDWPSDGPEIPGTATDTATAVKWKEAQDDAAIYGATYDEESDSPYYVYSSPDWHQVWYGNIDSMVERFDYINMQNIGGVGFWAVGFDEQDEELWAAVDEAFGEAPSDVGNLVGFIKEGDIYDGTPIAGARVLTTTGSLTTTDDTGYYAFYDLPAYVTYTITASAECYETTTTTKYVDAGIDNWKSIALTANCGDPGCTREILPLNPVRGSKRPIGAESTLLCFGVGLWILHIRRRRNR